ncbi:hypothetical protein [Colwellia sp. RSH04]|uniref:hypothetical protein n=1 Tax=Colwellia sp. RSH04 TaxID=2305464 RepID=UPI000E569D77|nr:hypothetical protein [Colwellia sp. RSH04]RHW77396.1 hypothetical protein D1094_00050 [Colwellia sp. RSH04]
MPLYIKLSDVHRIVHQVDLTINDRNWSVELGEKLGVSSHGAVGAAALSAAALSAGTVGQAIETFIQWFLLRCNVYKYSVSYQSNCVEVNVVYISGDPLFEQVFFNAPARPIEVMIEQLYGTFDWHDIQLSTKQIAAQGDLLQHRYKSQIIFDCAHNSVKLSHKIWNALNPLADDAAHQTHSNDCKMLAKSQQQNISIKQRVEAIIEQHYADVMAGRKETNIPPTLIVICEQLNMTERTLIRQLKQADIS